MIRERVSEDIYVFTSEMYAQVTAGLILTEEGSVVVDTMPFPRESRALRDFALKVSGPRGVRYVINTHSHADHVYGNYLFEDSEIIAHRRARYLMEKYGKPALEEAKVTSSELKEVRIKLPEMLVEDELTIRLGEKTIHIQRLPGNSEDGIGIHVIEKKVFFAGDVVMPVPYIVGGDLKQMMHSLQKISQLQLDALVPGHGPVLLKGEIPEKLSRSMSYLRAIDKIVEQAILRGKPKESLAQIGVEACGIPRIVLGGLAQDLHVANLYYLYDKKMEARQRRKAVANA
jgi:cyclase